MKPIYRALSLVNMIRAASKGPAALARYFIRRKSHGLLARWMRKGGL
ncbi:MAG: hypothetical protein AAGC92_16385 [Pseudomonadota bacterium]